MVEGNVQKLCFLDSKFVKNETFVYIYKYKTPDL
jgi:hypothetical protein